MSTKINVRSPFYINIGEPTVPTPLFTCETANIQGLSIDQQGQISTPSLSFGTIDSITSTDSEFSNNKFSTVVTNTNRTLTIRILIPFGFSNVADGYIDCEKTIVQPAVTCSGGPTTNGTIPAQSIDVNGATSTIDLTSYFTQGSESIAGYTIYNVDTNLVNASISGDTLTLSSNTIGGSTTIQVSAYDNGTNTCTATQSISVTVSNPTVTFDCDAASLSGGSIAQDGTITNPNTFADITAVKSTSGGASISSYPANTTGSDRSVTLYFDLTAPAGYSNAAATIECSATFTQPAANPEFTCDVANLSGQQISSKGSILVGTAQVGTIDSFTPISFEPVTTDTARTVTFTITIPSGYSNTGTIDCDKTITQPAEIATCGTNQFYISAPKQAQSGFCDAIYRASKSVTTDASTITEALGSRVCHKNSPFDGKSFYYIVSDNVVNAGAGTGQFYVWQIDSNGIIEDVSVGNCASGDDGNGKFGSL